MASKNNNKNKQKKYRMVALDLDGFIVAIATGRSAACTAHIIEALDLAPQDSAGFPLVCSNGAKGLRVQKSSSDLSAHTPSPSSKKTNPFLKQTLLINEELFHNPLPQDVALQTLALANKLGCATNYYHNHHIYAVVQNEDQLALTKRYGHLTGSTELYCYLNEDHESDNNGQKTTAVYNEENAYGYQKAMELGPPSKLLILCQTEKLDEITGLVRAELNGTRSDDDTKQKANVIRGTPPFFVEILDPTVHKGQGLQQLCTSLDIPLEEVIAFGDGDNDLEFIQMAGWGVAMKNARDVVKENADEVAEWTNDEDGVIKTLQRFEEEGRLHFPSGEDNNM